MPDGTRTAFGASHWGGVHRRGGGRQAGGGEAVREGPGPGAFHPRAAGCGPRRVPGLPAGGAQIMAGGRTRDERRAQGCGALRRGELGARARPRRVRAPPRPRRHTATRRSTAAPAGASAGGFHDARGQLARFLNLHGGFVDQVTNFSFGAASVIVPRIVGSMSPVVGTGQHLAGHRRAHRADGRLRRHAAKKPERQPGAASACMRGADWHRRAVEAGTEFVCVGPIRDDTADELAAQWHPIRPNTDLAVMLGIAHTLLVEGPARRRFPRALLHRLRPAGRIPAGRSGRDHQGTRNGHPRSRKCRPRPSAPSLAAWRRGAR